MFDNEGFVKRCIQNPHQNDAGAYGVTVEAFDNSEWICIGVHHLTPGENNFQNNVWIDVREPDGTRAQGVAVQWTWEGRTDPPLLTMLDKPVGEPDGNIALTSTAMRVSLWVVGAKSDVVRGLSSNHPDEAEQNRRGHHSFAVMYVRRGTPIPPSPQPPGTWPEGVDPNRVIDAVYMVMQHMANAEAILQRDILDLFRQTSLL